MAQHDNLEFGIRISTNDTFIANNSMDSDTSTSIGLYEVPGANDEFRWSTSLVNFTTDPWRAGPIVRGSISRISLSCDMRRGGNTNSFGGFSVDLDNTVLFWKTLEDNDIYLEGMAAELIEFDTENETQTVIYRGIVSFVSFSETEYNIRINIPNDKRKANISTVVSNETSPTATVEETGTTIPVAYGTVDRSAFIRTEEEKSIVDLTVLGSDLTPNDQKSLPVIEYLGDTIYVRVGLTTTIADTAAFTAALGLDLTDSHYVYVVSGGGQGQYRKIESIEWRPDRVPSQFNPQAPDLLNYRDYPVLKIEFDTYASADLVSEWFASLDDNSWVQLVSVGLSFDGETAQTAGFTDASGNIITDDITIYNSETDLRLDYNPITGELYDRVLAGEARYVPLPSYGVTLDASSDNTRITIDPRYIEKDISTIVSYGNIEIQGGFIEDDVSDLSLWCQPAGEEDDGFREFLLADGLQKNGKGLYTRNGQGNTSPSVTVPPYSSIDSTPTTADLNLIKDRKWSTYLKWSQTQSSVANLGGTNRPVYAIHALEFDFPYETLRDLDYDSLSLNIAADAFTTGNTLYAPGSPGFSGRIGTIDMVVRAKSFWGGVRRIYEDLGQDIDSRQGDNYYTFINGKPAHWCYNNNVSTQGDYSGGLFNNFLEEYWTGGDIPQGESYSDNDQDFYDDVPVYISSVGDGAAGIRRGIKNMEIPGGKDEHATIRKLGIFFIVQIATGSGTGLPFDLNIRQVSLTARSATRLNPVIYFPFQGRTDESESLIDNPISFLEDICYRQNWSELNVAPPSGGWGKGRTASALIKNDGEQGAFNFPGYAYERSLKLRNVITEESKAYTDKLKKKVCEQFFLASYQTNDGYDAIDSIVNPLTDYDSAYTTITLDEIIGKISPVTPNDYKDIFCEPTIYYDYNVATRKYDKNMQVNNVDQSTFDPSYVTGTGLSDGYKEDLWNLARGLFLKYKIINEAPKQRTELDLIYRDEEAGYYLYNWLYWQNRKRIRFDIPYGLGRDWHISKRFKLSLPHQTAGQELYCIVEKISKDIPTDFNRNRVNVQAVIYNAADTERYFIQDTYEGSTDWTDTYGAYDEEIQDNLE